MIWLVQLVFDCADPDALARFWGRALGYRNSLVDASTDEIAAFRVEHPQFDGRGRIDDLDLRRPPVYIQQVPETKHARNRIRLDLVAAEREQTIRRLLDLGATPTEAGGFADVEGNEFTLSENPTAREVRLGAIVMDALDPARLLEFWSSATGYIADGPRLRCEAPARDLRWEGDHFELEGRRLRHTCGMGADAGAARFDLVPGLQFVLADEPKSLKNRVHVDLNSDDVEFDRERLVGLGATVLRWDTDQVLADPEGNEFCLSG